MTNNALSFLAALLGGGIGIYLTKSAFANAWFAAVVAAVTVAGLTIYYVLNDEDAREEKADNVYYLGLLFTLISLMFSLVELFGADTEEVRSDEKIHDLLKNFGIALTSTIAGIACRILVLNWPRAGLTGPSEFARGYDDTDAPPAGAGAQDPEGTHRLLVATIPHGPNRIAHELRRIARELNQAVNALARFNRLVRSHMNDTEERLHNHSETLKSQSTAFKDTLQRNTETFSQELKSQAESTLDAIGGSLGTAARQAESLVEQLQSAHASYLAEVRETTRSFHDEIRSASAQSLDALRGNFDAAAKQSLSLTQSVSTTHERVVEAFDRLGSGLGHAGDASAAFGDRAQETAKAIASLELTVNKVGTALEPVHAGTETMKGVFDAISEFDAHIRTSRDTEQTVAATREIGETLHAITDQGAAAVERAAKAVELIDALTQGLRTTEEQTRRTADALHVLADEAKARTRTLRQRRRFGFWRFWSWHR